MSRYPGGKNGSGVFQRIINLMPPHKIYIEPFLGSGAVLAHKRPAVQSVGLDLDARNLINWTLPGLELLEADAIAWLAARRWLGGELVYCDPPYLPSTRRGGRIYDFELSHADHVRLLDVLLAAPALVMLSGYASPLYQAKLADWSLVEYQTTTRAGPVNECLWFNFAPPDELHDYRYLGATFGKRQQLKRKIARWKAKLANMPAIERRALMGAIQDTAGDIAEPGLVRRRAEPKPALRPRARTAIPD